MKLTEALLVIWLYAVLSLDLGAIMAIVLLIVALGLPLLAKGLISETN